jgi:hypothetical protein
MVARQAAFPVWMDQVASASAGAFVYGATWYSAPDELSDDVTLDYVGTVYNGVNRAGPVDSGLTISTTGPRNEATYAVMGIDDNTGTAPWVWCSKNIYIYPFITGFVTSGTLDLSLEKWSGRGDKAAITATTPVTITANGLAVGSFLNVDPGWYRLTPYYNTLARFKSASITLLSSNTSLTFSGTVITSPACAGPNNNFMPLPVTTEFTNSPLPWTDTRVTAAALLLTNVTKAVNKEGSVVWARVSPDQWNPFAIGMGAVQSFHPAERAQFPLETGTYTYTMPGTDLGYFQPYTVNVQSGGGAVVIGATPAYRLDSPAMVHVGFMLDADSGTTLTFQFDYHLEFRTNSTLFDIAVASLPMEALHQAQLELFKRAFSLRTSLIGTRSPGPSKP